MLINYKFLLKGKYFTSILQTNEQNHSLTLQKKWKKHIIFIDNFKGIKIKNKILLVYARDYF